MTADSSAPGLPGAGARIVCLGDLMIDVVALLPGALATGSDTPAPIGFIDGGSAANTAAWLARLGARAAFAGRVGDDAFGHAAIAKLVAAGVQPHVTVDPTAATGTCLVLVSPDGERTMVPSAGANATLRRDDVTALLSEGNHLHLSGYALLTEGSRDAARYALALAAEVGATVSVDAASAAPIRAVGADRLLGWLPRGTLLLANADELAALTADRPDAVAWLVAQGFTVVVKRGAAGAELGTPAGIETVPTEPVHVLDSTGAGDAFAAGLLAALTADATLIDAISDANAAGARAVGTVGGRPA